MGLLDDAIREHLELRRLRGVDSSKVSYEEQEALGSMLGVLDAAANRAEIPRALGRDFASNDADAPCEPKSSHEGQETMEFDMMSVLGADSIEMDGCAKPDSLPHAGRTTSSRARVDGPGLRDDPMEGSPEWGLPGQRGQGSNEPHPVDRRPRRILNVRESHAADIGGSARGSLIDPSDEKPVARPRAHA
jgi:hypothetical protein